MVLYLFLKTDDMYIFLLVVNLFKREEEKKTRDKNLYNKIIKSYYYYYSVSQLS